MRGKLLLTLGVSILVPTIAAAAPSVGGCGLGSKVFAGQSGIAPQILAVTTNGTSGNQTFGITTGTLGCKPDGTVSSNWKTAMFIGENTTKLAKDMSVGKGETLDSLASLLGMDKTDKELFFLTTKSNFQEIYPDENTTAMHVLTSLKQVLHQHPQLSQYASAI